MNGPEPTSTHDTTCRCGHASSLHQHYRAGTDCASCGPQGCPRYRPRTTRLRRLLTRLRRP